MKAERFVPYEQAYRPIFVRTRADASPPPLLVVHESVGRLSTSWVLTYADEKPPA